MPVYFSSPDPNEWPQRCRPLPDPSTPFQDDVQFAVSFTCQEIPADYGDANKCVWVGPAFDPTIQAGFDAFLSQRPPQEARADKLKKFIVENAVFKEQNQPYLCQPQIDRWVLEKHEFRKQIAQYRGGERREALDYWGGARLRQIRAYNLNALGAAGYLKAPPTPIGIPCEESPGEGGEGPPDLGPRGQTDFFRTPGFISGELAIPLTAVAASLMRYLPYAYAVGKVAAWTGWRSAAPVLGPWPWLYRDLWTRVVSPAFRLPVRNFFATPLRLAGWVAPRFVPWLAVATAGALMVYGLDRFWAANRHGDNEEKTGFLEKTPIGEWNGKIKSGLYNGVMGLGHFVNGLVAKLKGKDL